MRIITIANCWLNTILFTYVGLASSFSQTSNTAPSRVTNAGVHNQENRLAEFKEFISHPPVIDNLIYEVCRPSDTNQDVLACKCVLLRYQTNGFFYREAPRLVDVVSTNFYPGYRLGGCFNKEFWSYSLDGRVMEMFTNGNRSMEMTLDFLKAGASEVLNLGIFDTMPGTIRWNENSLVPFTNHAGVRVLKGDLVVEDNQPPTKLTLLLEHEGNEIPWELDYSYTDNMSMPSFMPSTIVGWSFLNGTKRFSFQINLKSTEIRSGLMPRESFMPGAYFNRDTLIINEESKRRMAAGTVLQTKQGASPVFVAFILLNVAIAVGLLVFFGKKTKKQT